MSIKCYVSEHKTLYFLTLLFTFVSAVSRHPPISISCVSIKALPFPFVVVVIPVYSLSVSEFDGFIDPFLFVDFEIIQAGGRTQRFALCLFLLPLESVKLKLKYSSYLGTHQSSSSWLQAQRS